MPSALYPRPNVEKLLPPGLVANILGVRDAVEPVVASPQLAYSILNLFPTGTRWYGRPGFRQAGSQLETTAQLLYSFQKQDGTLHSVRICGGKFYTYDWASGSWTEMVNAAAFTAAGITLDASAICHATTFNDKLIVNDSVNRPWSWDGTTGGGLSLLSNAPSVCYGVPVVYAGKLFFIMGNERLSFAWSEELAENTGYEAGGYNNTWEFAQTAQDRLVRMVGTNQGLVVFRGHSISLILGEVATDFRSASTDEAISGTLGTLSPDSIVEVGQSIFFLDQRGRPQLLRLGSGVVGEEDDGVDPIWWDCAELMEKLTRSDVANWQGVYRNDLDLVLFSYWEDGRSARDRIMCFRPDTGQYTGRFTGFQVDRIAMLRDNRYEDNTRMMHDEGDGYAYWHGLPGENVLTDELNAGDAGIVHEIAGPALHYEIDAEKRWERADIELRGWSGLTTISFDYQTPRSRNFSTAQTVAVSAADDDTLVWDDGLWDDGEWDYENYAARAALGLAANGRWIRPRIRHTTAGERFGFSAMMLTGFRQAKWPGLL